jgi:cysteine synthase
MKRITGLPDDLVPKILDRSVVDEIVPVEDSAAYEAAILVAQKSGILVGPTTGAVLSVALGYARQNQGTAVVIAPDDAFKYVSFFRPYVEHLGQPKA